MGYYFFPPGIAVCHLLGVKFHFVDNEAQKKADENRWTIARLWETYKASKPNLKGIVTDENRFHNYVKPAFGSMLPSEIDPLSVDRLRVNLLKKKSTGTVKNVLELLRRVCNFGVKKNLTDGLSFAIEMPNLNNLRTEDLTADELEALLKAIDADDNIQAANLMKMVLYPGMRRSELFRLRWTDIDETRGFIKIVDPKGGIDQTIPLNDAARDLLKDHPFTGSEYVFPGRGGNQRKDIHHQVNRIRDNAGLPKDFRALHGLRHVYASMLASSGRVDLYTLQRLLTHKSPSMTMRYAHLRDEALKEASQVAGAIVSGAAMKSKENKVVNLAHREEIKLEVTNCDVKLEVTICDLQSRKKPCVDIVKKLDPIPINDIAFNYVERHSFQEIGETNSSAP